MKSVLNLLHSNCQYSKSLKRSSNDIGDGGPVYFKMVTSVNYVKWGGGVVIAPTHSTPPQTQHKKSDIQIQELMKKGGSTKNRVSVLTVQFVSNFCDL